MTVAYCKAYFFASGVFAAGPFLQRPPRNIEPAVHVQSVRALHSASVLMVLQETAVFSCAETSKMKDESARTTAVAANTFKIALLTGGYSASVGPRDRAIAPEYAIG